MNNRYFLIFLFLIILSTSIYPVSLDIDSSKNYYYYQEIDLFPRNLPESTHYFELLITSKETVLFRDFFTKDDLLVFVFNKDYPKNLSLRYTLFSYNQSMIDTFNFSLTLKEIDKINFYTCSDFSCSQEIFNPIPSNKDFYISSSNNNLVYEINISNEKSTRKETSTLPFLLNLENGVYDIVIFPKDIFPEIKHSFTLLVENQENIIQNNFKPEIIIDDTISQDNKSKNNMLIYTFLSLIILVVIYLLFNFGKRKNMVEKTKKTIEKTNKKSRRELRKISLLFIFLIIFATSLNASVLDREYQYSFFTDDYSKLLEDFPALDEVNLYITDIRKENSFFLPIISYNITEYTLPTNFSIPEGVLEYKPLTVLFAIDSKKAEGQYAPFLPKTPYPQYCSPVLNYFNNNPIVTKSDLLNRNKEYLIKEIGFSRDCLDFLIENNWIFEKQIISEIKFSPYNFNDLSKIIQAELNFPQTVLSNEKRIVVNIIKNDSAVVYAYPNPKTYNDILLEVYEKGWHFSNKVSYPHALSDLEEVFRLSFNQGIKGSPILSLNNYNDDFVSFNFKFLDQEKEIFFNNVLTSNFISLDYNHSSKNIISRLTFTENHLVINNFDIFNFSEKRKRRLSINHGLESYKRLISRKDYTLFQTPFFDQNNFILSLSNGKSLRPIIKDNFYLFYNFENGSFGNLDLFIVDGSSDTYYFSENSADYSLKTFNYTLGNDVLKVNSITTSEEKTSFEIYFKEEDESVRIISDRKNIVFTKNPNFYIYKNYMIVTLSGDLRVYLLDDFYHSFKKNTFSNYSFNFNFLSGSDFSEKSLLLKNYTNYIYDISTANDLSNTEKKLFWANSYNNLYDLENDFWFFKDSFICQENFDSFYDSHLDYFKKLDFTILKYPSHFNMPFSQVLTDTKEYIIKRNTFSRDNLSFLCKNYQEGEFSNYSSLIFDSVRYLKDKDDFISSLYYLSSTISRLFSDDEYKIKYQNEYLSTDKEGIVFFDRENNITGALPLDFKNNFSSSINILNYYTIFDRLSYKEPINLVFDIDTEKNNKISLFINNTYISDKERLSLKFKLPKRNPILTDDFISKNFISSARANNYLGNCSKLSLDAARRYNYNNVREFSENNYWWGSDFRREDAWFLGRENQVIWNYKKDPLLNRERLFEGIILGVYIGSTQYTYSENNPVKERAGKTFTNLLYTHAMPYLDNYRGQKGITLNAGSRSVTIENAFNYYSTYGRELRELIVPRNYYDDSITDKYGKTELDYVKEYITSFD